MDATAATDAGMIEPQEGFGLDAAVEAILLTTERPLAPAKVAEALSAWLGEGADGEAEVAAAVERLNEQYSSGGRAFRIEQVAGGGYDENAPLPNVGGFEPTVALKFINVTAGPITPDPDPSASPIVTAAPSPSASPSPTAS